MAHPEQRAFIAKVKNLYPQMFIHRRVLDVGSLNINGTNREFFTDCDVTGIDLAPGPGVDVVCPAHAFGQGPFDVVICTECLEHDIHWRWSVRNMQRLAATMLLLTCATTGRQEHGTHRSKPQDSPFTNTYYKNVTVAELAANLNVDEFADARFEVNNGSHDLYFVGMK